METHQKNYGLLEPICPFPGCESHNLRRIPHRDFPKSNLYAFGHESSIHPFVWTLFHPKEHDLSKYGIDPENNG